MINKTYQLETITCPSCVMKIEGMLKKTTGIIKSEVLYNTSRVKVTFDENVISSEIIKEKITSLGYVVKSEK